MLDRLDTGDKHYTRKYQDMQDRLDNLYDKVAEFEEAMKDIDAKILLTALGIKNENGLKWALDRLPHADNDIIRLKEFCDKNNISYHYEMED